MGQQREGESKRLCVYVSVSLGRVCGKRERILCGITTERLRGWCGVYVSVSQ